MGLPALPCNGLLGWFWLISYNDERSTCFFFHRYASKESDTWIRALVKDLTIEAGSGHVILDPVDISGGYTSVKEKTSISITSTDICIHLSLSVISLALHLQNQATEALQFGNASPLVSCTNFDRVWTSQKGLFQSFYWNLRSFFFKTLCGSY